MGRPAIIDPEDMLTRWSRGETSGPLAKLYGVTGGSIRSRIRRAAADGDPRALARPKGRPSVHEIIGKPIPEYLTEPTAPTLVARIRAYWERRGKSVNVWSERRNAHDRPTDRDGVWVVRSDMVDGLPR